MAGLWSMAARSAQLDRLRRRLDERRSVNGGVRVDPGRGGVVAMAALAVLVATAAVCWVLASRPQRLPVAASVLTSPAASLVPGGSLTSPISQPAAASTGTGAAQQLVVDVVGKVHRPGVYRLAPGSRVEDAVTAAGGVLAGVDPVSVNLARKLTDGEQVVIGQQPAPAPAAPASAGSTAGSARPAGPVDLNSATAAELDGLPGVGPVLAQRIVDWRTQHGRFDSVDQLRKVSGIGDAKFNDLKALVTAG